MMTDSGVLERIAVWEATGLIDAETAARLRTAEAERPTPPPETPSGARSVFGPTPTIAEVLGYVGGAFLLAAWFVLMGTQGPDAGAGSSTWTITFGLAALATAGVGLVLQGRGERGMRAAGVAFAVAVACAYGTGFNVVMPASDSQVGVPLLAGGLVALVVAIGPRLRHPALLTQAALLGAVLSAALGIGTFLRERLFGQGGTQDLTDMALELGLWIAAAVVLGAIGLFESRSLDVPAVRRAGLSRFAAGLTAVVATWSILTRTGPRGASDPDGNYDDYGPLLEPFVAEIAIAAVALALLWLAFRRGATVYLYPAALGIILALTNLNSTYVADRVGTGVALLLEGLLILGAGITADRLRRRLKVG